MKRMIIMAMIVLGAMSCKKEEVLPNGYDVPVTVTNHVRITIHSKQVGDYLDVVSGNWGAAVYLTNIIHASNYLCNLTVNLKGFGKVGDCNSDVIELTAKELIYIDYKGDVTIEYL